MKTARRSSYQTDTFRRPHPTLVTVPIHYFRTTAKLGSIRAAAEYLRVAPSAVSRQIGKLETAIGARLFERLPRGLRLNSIGELFLYHAREGMNQIDRARSLIDEMRGMRQGHVTIITTESVANGLLPNSIVEFWKQYPEISVTVNTARSLNAFNAVLAGEADLALGFDRPSGLPLQTLAMAILHIGVVVSRDHPFAKAKTVRLKDLANERILLPDDTVGLRGILNPYLQRASEIEPRAVSNSLTMLEVLSSLKGGVLLQTKIGMGTDWHRHNLAFVRLHELGPKTQSLQLCSRSTHLLPSADAFAKHIGSAIRKLSDV
jgi:DNA-binding transcriptional LysR family regulator